MGTSEILLTTVDDLIVIIDVAEAACVTIAWHLLIELTVLVLEVVLGSFWQLVVVVHVDGTVDFLVIDMRGNMPERILLVNILLAWVVVVTHVRVMNVSPLGG